MSDYVSPEEAAARRAAYTWKQATTDLAYMTRLTLMESVRVIDEFHRSNVCPYDALPWMVKIFNAGNNPSGTSTLARAVVELIRLERTLDQGNG